MVMLLHLHRKQIKYHQYILQIHWDNNKLLLIITLMNCIMSAGPPLYLSRLKVLTNAQSLRLQPTHQEQQIDSSPETLLPIRQSLPAQLCPMNILSIILYSDMTNMPTTAGKLYFHRSLPTGDSLNSRSFDVSLLSVSIAFISTKLIKLCRRD